MHDPHPPSGWHPVFLDWPPCFQLLHHAPEGSSMTEAQIERFIERMFDALDARLMRNEISQQEYDANAATIDHWTRQAYARRSMTRSVLTDPDRLEVYP
jgi:hypothetical protein